MSEWKERSNKRRDERRTAIDDSGRPAASKKNTKRWCRGVVGREHDPKCVRHKTIGGWWNYECQSCKKVLDYHFRSVFWGGNSPRPAWLVET